MFTHVIVSLYTIYRSRCGPHFRARPPHASANTGCLNRGIPDLRTFASEASSRLKLATNSMPDNYQRPLYLRQYQVRRPSEYDEAPNYLLLCRTHTHQLQRFTKLRLYTSFSKPPRSRYSLHLYSSGCKELMFHSNPSNLIPSLVWPTSKTLSKPFGRHSQPKPWMLPRLQFPVRWLAALLYQTELESMYPY